MVTTSHIGDRPNLIKVQLEGLSTDKKPIKETSDGLSIKNGSTFTCIDTLDVFFL
jgi:hypothetical protein